MQEASPYLAFLSSSMNLTAESTVVVSTLSWPSRSTASSPAPHPAPSPLPHLLLPPQQGHSLHRDLPRRRRRLAAHTAHGGAGCQTSEESAESLSLAGRTRRGREEGGGLETEGISGWRRGGRGTARPACVKKTAELQRAVGEDSVDRGRELGWDEGGGGGGNLVATRGEVERGRSTFMAAAA